MVLPYMCFLFTLFNCIFISSAVAIVGKINNGGKESENVFFNQNRVLPLVYISLLLQSCRLIEVHMFIIVCTMNRTNHNESKRKVCSCIKFEIT